MSYHRSRPALGEDGPANNWGFDPKTTTCDADGNCTAVISAPGAATSTSTWLDSVLKPSAPTPTAPKTATAPSSGGGLFGALTSIVGAYGASQNNAAQAAAAQAAAAQRANSGIGTGTMIMIGAGAIALLLIATRK